MPAAVMLSTTRTVMQVVDRAGARIGRQRGHPARTTRRGPCLPRFAPTAGSAGRARRSCPAVTCLLASRGAARPCGQERREQRHETTDRFIAFIESPRLRPGRRRGRVSAPAAGRVDHANRCRPPAPLCVATTSPLGLDARRPLARIVTASPLSHDRRPDDHVRSSSSPASSPPVAPSPPITSAAAGSRCSGLAPGSVRSATMSSAARTAPAGTARAARAQSVATAHGRDRVAGDQVIPGGAHRSSSPTARSASGRPSLAPVPAWPRAAARACGALTSEAFDALTSGASPPTRARTASTIAASRAASRRPDGRLRRWCAAARRPPTRGRTRRCATQRTMLLTSASISSAAFTTREFAS